MTVPLFHEHRIFCQVAGHHMNVIKALPALVIEEEEVRRFAAALEEVVASGRALPLGARPLRAAAGAAGPGQQGLSPGAAVAARAQVRAWSYLAAVNTSVPNVAGTELASASRGRPNSDSKLASDE